MGDIHRCLPNIDVLISIFDILTSMVFFFKRQYFIDVRNKTSNIDKKKKNKQEYSFQEMTWTALLGSARVYLAPTSQIGIGWSVSAAALPSHLLLRFILSLSWKGWKWTEQKWKTSCCQFYYFCNLLIKVFGTYNFRNFSWIPRYLILIFWYFSFVL
jgi:hypothetical protein